MAAYLPPCDTETLMSDIGPTKVLVPPPSVLRLPSTAVLMDKNGNGSSPLKVFVQAKRSINDIFREMSEYAAECGQFVSSVPREHDDLVGDKARNTLQSFQAKVKGIHALLQRNHMKVTFFGRTSNGKSSVINAMLGSKILPSGIGHTTNCFLQVAASDREGAYLKVAETNEIRDVTSVDRLGHALCEEKLGESSIVQIYWPAEKCPLLKDDVVFVDSPGIDVSPNLDEWIDQHCLDADVFVLVSNAESTLMVTEKNFFHKVSEKLSKPNIFILNNRWDASASEPQMMEQASQRK
ncbi:unnamed protein product [Cyprideis torosa]|uniref:Uncharacterized protein n=1 Tax=Cyprideis torosa TaxID=163714 RepID=A0A7R8WKG6_9CRUS|nr:unnamed protein product [Cyprideis torosa]CAG0903127.1 unnamed protein product [Cyprideis torosa]